MLVLCALGAALAGPATLVVANWLFAWKAVGYTPMILTQLAHDCVPLFTLAIGARATTRLHARPHVVVVAAGALLLAALEPVFSPRIDTVVAAWQGLRLVARLSALLFAVTLASYWDR